MKSAALLFVDFAAFLCFIVLLATLLEPVMAGMWNAVDVDVGRVGGVGRARGRLVLLLERVERFIAMLSFGVTLRALLVGGTFRHSESLVKKLASAFV